MSDTNKYEFETKKRFLETFGKLESESETDGTIPIYKRDSNSENQENTKPDLYFENIDGVNFIVELKKPSAKIKNKQLINYMKLEKKQKSVDNFAGIYYDVDNFQFFNNGKLVESETELKNWTYYINKYFSGATRKTHEEIVEQKAKELAHMFRNSRIDKQNNVPFIGAVILCYRYKKDIDLSDAATTKSILNDIKKGLEKIFDDEPSTKQEKLSILNRMLDEITIQKANKSDLIQIINTIEKINNNIVISEQNGKDIMNFFLRVFRKWNNSESNEKGEVFTPDHIAQLMIKLIDLNVDDVVMDPACGSGTFLTNAMHFMLDKAGDDLDKQNRIKASQVIGIETNTFNATLAMINMLLHGDGSSQIKHGDCFKVLPTEDQKYNKVLMNPPFSQQRFPELKFVKAALDHCRANGLVASVLPLSVIEKIKEHDLLKKHTLKKVVILNKQLFHGNAAIWTGVAVFEAHVPHEENSIIESFNYEEDGYVVKRNVGRYLVDKNVEPDFEDKSEKLISDINLFHHKIKIKELDITKRIAEYFGSLIVNRLIKKSYLNFLKDDFLKIDKTWKEFNVVDLFDLDKGREKNSDVVEKGIPLIAAKKVNEGIAGYKSFDEVKKVYEASNEKPLLVVVNQGDGGSGMTFVKTYDFVATPTVTILKPKYGAFNFNHALFIATVCTQLWFKKYGYGLSLKHEKLSIETILLPSKLDKDKYVPDWELINKLMSEYYEFN